MTPGLLDFVFGVVVGLIQGYLVVPMVMLSPLLAKRALSTWAPGSYSFGENLATIMAAALILLANIALAITLQRAVPFPITFGKAWALGLFVGLLAYAMAPATEQALRRRRGAASRSPRRGQARRS